MGRTGFEILCEWDSIFSQAQRTMGGLERDGGGHCSFARCSRQGQTKPARSASAAPVTARAVATAATCEEDGSEGWAAAEDEESRGDRENVGKSQPQDRETTDHEAWLVAIMKCTRPFEREGRSRGGDEDRARCLMKMAAGGDTVRRGYQCRPLRRRDSSSKSTMRKRKLAIEDANGRGLRSPAAG